MLVMWAIVADALFRSEQQQQVAHGRHSDSKFRSFLALRRVSAWIDKETPCATDKTYLRIFMYLFENTRRFPDFHRLD